MYDSACSQLDLKAITNEFVTRNASCLSIFTNFSMYKSCKTFNHCDDLVPIGASKLKLSVTCLGHAH